ncbi:MAG: hypothetical protein ACI4A7_08500 [Prevotella sp.]
MTIICSICGICEKVSSQLGGNIIIRDVDLWSSSFLQRLRVGEQSSGMGKDKTSFGLLLLLASVPCEIDKIFWDLFGSFGNYAYIC